MTSSRRFVNVLTPLLGVVAAFVGCSAIGLAHRPIHPGVEPPDRTVELIQREHGWTYLPSLDDPKTVVIPYADLELLLQDRDDWKLSSQAHHNAVEWEDQ